MTPHPSSFMANADAPGALDLVTFAVEPYAAFKATARSTLEQHWRELAAYPDIPLAIDDAQYEALERAGQLLIIAMRVADHLCGYAVYFVAPHAHYAGSLQAKEDVIYVHPAVRHLGLGRNLIRQSELILRGLGVQAVYHGVKRSHPGLGALLAQEGYDPIETIFAKRLDR